MDLFMEASKDAQEPAWLEKDLIGDLRVWQIMFMCFAAVTSLIVIVCCCFRFRIPRTKQQIQADYQRRKITGKFRQRLETIQDTKMNAMSLQDALELLHEEVMEGNNQSSPPDSTPPQQAPPPAAPAQPQGAGSSFARFASKVAVLSKLAPRSPTETTPSPDNKLNV